MWDMNHFVSRTSLVSFHIFDLTFSQDAPDIQLNVKGMKTLYDSFKDYVAVEILDGEKQYQTERFGLQDAKKGIIFESFPPVLHLQLKRFECDTQRDAMVEIDDRHEFPFEINLDEFRDASADRSQPWIYKLYGVLVYSGDQYGGHYFALIKPDRETRWLKFDDDRVTTVTDQEVLEENYGGKVPNGMRPTLQRNGVHAMKCFTLASKLVYIRESAIDEVLAPCTVDDIPTHLSMCFISCFRGVTTWLLTFEHIEM
jgi:ubiquitin carboxyl-terminal hydrolase 7